jgi:hypothetical protein
MSDDNDTTSPCEPYLILMMGFIDGELDRDEEKRFKDHAYQCPSCAEELTKYQKLAALTDSLKLKEPADYEWERIYGSLTYKIESGFGWFMVIGGIVIVLAYLLYELIMEWEVAAWLRVGIVMAFVGFAVLLVSALRQRIRIKKYERYETVKR